jgi:hypothetical protein
MKGASQIKVEGRRRNEEAFKSAISARSANTRPRDSRSGCLVRAKRWVIRKSSGSKSDLIRLNPTSAFFYFFGRAIRTGWKSGRRPALRYGAPGRPGAFQDASRDSMRGAGQGQSRSVKVNQGTYRERSSLEQTIPLNSQMQTDIEQARGFEIPGRSAKVIDNQCLLFFFYANFRMPERLRRAIIKLTRHG